MTELTALVTVATAGRYEEMAVEMFQTADRFFKPTPLAKFVRLAGKEGAWPAGTMYRHHILRDAMPKADYVFLIDADMRFERRVGPEILPFPDGLTATMHPGYVGKPHEHLPFERRTESACYVAPGENGVYYCGGFVGGTRTAMQVLSSQIAALVDADVERGITPTWHDESALNRVLVGSPPKVVLSPSYCYPDDDEYYVRHVWSVEYQRRIVALDKTPEERGDRG